MNYQKIYDNIVERAKTENREKNDIVYYEAHHIVPICLGGTGNVKQYKKHENIVLLTAREHFICHWILHELYPENKELTKAFYLMCAVENGKQERYRPSSRVIEYAKIKNREARKKQIGYWEGKNLSDETKEKLRISQLGKKHSEETRKKMSESSFTKGKKRDPKIIKKGLDTKLKNKVYEKIRKKIYDTETGIVYESVRSCIEMMDGGSRKVYKNLKIGVFKYLKQNYE